MNKNTLLCFQIFNKSKTFSFIKESNHPCSYYFTLFSVFLFWYTYLHLFLLKDFLFLWIRWRRRNVSILINVSHHFLQCFSLLGICFTFFHLFNLVLPLF